MTTPLRTLTTLLAGLTVAAAALAQQPMSSGQVVKLDKAAARVTLKHGEIKHLDMPPMTMVYRATDPKMLDGLAVGDRVRFAADKVNGQYVLVAVTKAP
jgi:Cu/Ag efflux protein CusF